MKLAVLGAGEFIGSHLVEHLLQRDHEVVGLDRETTSPRSWAGSDSLSSRRTSATIRTSPMASGEWRVRMLSLYLLAHANPSFYVEMPLEVVDLVGGYRICSDGQPGTEKGDAHDRRNTVGSSGESPRPRQGREALPRGQVSGGRRLWGRYLAVLAQMVPPHANHQGQ